MSENVEEYLEALLIFEENDKPLVKIKEISSQLKVASPSAVQMLKKLEKRGYVKYRAREGVELTAKGRAIATRILRNHRLIEVLMKKTLQKNIDEEVVCGIEHHLSEEIADAICTSLGHPRRCPHGNAIPRGKCCGKADAAAKIL